MSRYVPHVEVPLRARDGSVCALTLVDAEDADIALAASWRLSTDGYAVRAVRVDGARRWLLLHRVLFGLDRGDACQLDHANRNRLDNRRANLRLATQAQNCQNITPRRGTSSCFRGVSWAKRERMWRAYLNVNRRQHGLGYFALEEDAAQAAADARALYMPFSAEAAA